MRSGHMSFRQQQEDPQDLFPGQKKHVCQHLLALLLSFQHFNMLDIRLLNMALKMATQVVFIQAHAMRIAFYELLVAQMLAMMQVQQS